MTIASKPKPTKETKAQRFIRGASPAGQANGARKIKPILIGFDEALLQRLDLVRSQMGLSRTAFVNMAIAERVIRAERGE